MYFNYNSTISFDVFMYNCTYLQLGVHATSWIMMAESQKPSLSTLIMKLILIFDLTIPVDSQALPGFSPQSKYWVCPTFMKSIFLKSS